MEAVQSGDPVGSDRTEVTSAETAASGPPLLAWPADGIPAVVDDAAALHAAAAELAGGDGPVAIDTERASGYRYSQRAYLVQVRRNNAGTVLVDPIALGGDLSPIVDALTGSEWVLHAASQDLPCLAELDLVPSSLFDTELAGRLAGFDRVSLGALVERMLSLRLEKGHGAADWSRRPLPTDWLIYAALDVELLVELRAVLKAELESQGKLEWAFEEFEAVRTAPPPPPRAEPWRRTSGIHRVRKPRELAALRALWQARDELARKRDVAPGRVLPDSSIVRAAQENPKTQAELTALPVFGGKQQRRRASMWLQALHSVQQLADDQLPDPAPRNDGPPPASRWSDRDPQAAARLSTARSQLAKIAETHGLPVENVVLPELVRRLCWQPPEPSTVRAVEQALLDGGARQWQITLVAEALSSALNTPN